MCLFTILDHHDFCVFILHYFFMKFIFNKSTVVCILKRRLLYFIMEMSVVPNFDINWNELGQIEMDDELENTFLRLTALDVPLNIHIDENTILTVAEVHQPPL